MCAGKTSRADAGALRLADFAGSWRLDRQITHGDGRRFTAEGRATLLPGDGGLIYRETGTLNLPGGGALSFEQGYRWVQAGEAIEVGFEDGRPFHRFSATRPLDRHLCAPDTYDMLYEFDLPGGWSTTCTTSGPRKDYVSVTHYRREE